MFASMPETILSCTSGRHSEATRFVVLNSELEYSAARRWCQVLPKHQLLCDDIYRTQYEQSTALTERSKFDRVSNMKIALRRTALDS
jgi:hypothetical protein